MTSLSSKLLIAFSCVAFSIQLKFASAATPVLDASSGVLTPALQLDEMMEPTHKIRVATLADDKGITESFLELDPNVPQFDEFGNLKKTERKPLLKLPCTLKLVKSSGELQLLEIKGRKIESRLFLVTGDGSFRLLVHGKDAKVKHVVWMNSNIEERPLPPCHPGCFPAGTAVRVERGVVPIERIGKGDVVTTVDADGKAVARKVTDVFVTKNTLVQVRTSEGILSTTATQPLCLASGKFAPAGDLKAGDKIWQWHSGERRAVAVVEVTPTKRETEVYNLVLGDSIVFIAGDFLARSKPPAEKVIAAKP